MKIDFSNIDRRIIYLLTAIALSLPLILKYSIPPAKMHSAQSLYDVVETLEVKPGDIAFVALDWGPNTIAENGPQSEVIIEHLFRKRIPVALFSVYVFAEPFLVSVPEKLAQKLNKETGETWEYGRDWVNLGARPGAGLLIQSIPKSDDLSSLFKEDAQGTPLNQVPAFKNVRTLNNIAFLGEITGLSGVFDSYVQFFQKTDYKPKFGHGCTSIVIPEAYIYLDSGQIVGLLEGIAGAAWYSELLKIRNPARKKDSAILINTGLGIAHLLIIVLVILGNIATFWRARI